MSKLSELKRQRDEIELGMVKETLKEINFFDEESQRILEEAKKLVIRLGSKTDLKEMEDPAIFKNIVRREMKAFLYKETRRSPMILPIVTEG